MCSNRMTWKCEPSARLRILKLPNNQVNCLSLILLNATWKIENQVLLNCFCRSVLSSFSCFPLILLVDEGKNEQNQKDEQSNQNPGIHFDEGILMACEIPFDFLQILI